MLTLLACGNVRPNCASLGDFDALCVAGVGGLADVRLLAARLLALFCVFILCIPLAQD